MIQKKLVSIALIFNLIYFSSPTQGAEEVTKSTSLASSQVNLEEAQPSIYDKICSYAKAGYNSGVRTTCRVAPKVINHVCSHWGFYGSLFMNAVSAMTTEQAACPPQFSFSDPNGPMHWDNVTSISMEQRVSVQPIFSASSLDHGILENIENENESQFYSDYAGLIESMTNSSFVLPLSDSYGDSSSSILMCSYKTSSYLKYFIERGLIIPSNYLNFEEITKWIPDILMLIENDNR